MKLPRLLVPASVCAALILTGCSSDPEESATDPATDAATETVESGGVCDATVSGSAEAVEGDPDEEASRAALAGISLSDGAAAAPTVTFDAPLDVTAEVVQVTDDGDGDALAAGDIMTINYLVCDIVTGEKLYSTWGVTADDDAPETYRLLSTDFGEALTSSLDGAAVGTRLLWGQPSISAEESYSGEAINGYLYVMTVTDMRPVADSASGTEVTPTDESLPAITMEDGKPAVSFPESFTEPSELVVQPLIEGDGATVEAGQTLIVKYSGWLTDGTSFDSSWEREAPNDVLTLSIGTGGVIQGWDQGLVGQTVGSRLLLVVPADLAYGDTERGTIPADSTLVFVVDILAAY